MRGEAGYLLLFFSDASRPRYLPMKELTDQALAELLGISEPPTLTDLRCPKDGKKVRELLHPSGFSYKQCGNTNDEHYYDVLLCPIDKQPMYPYFDANVGSIRICSGPEAHRWKEDGGLLAA
jgi:hypothetical protein